MYATLYITNILQKTYKYTHEGGVVRMKLKICAAALVLAILLTLLPIYASAAPAFSDISGNMAEEAINKWSGWGILSGCDGRFNPAGPITRADMAVIIDRIMNYRTVAPNTFSDLKDTYYTDAVLKANAAGVLLGDSSMIRPTAEITREEAAVILGRALGMTESNVDAGFRDRAEISSWALSYVNAMATRGIMNGYQNAFNPREAITRAEVVAVLNNAIAGLFTKPAEYTGNFNGTVVVSAPGVVLRDMEISGDLIIAQGVGTGEVTLINVSIAGSMSVRSGRVTAAGTFVGTAGMGGEIGVLGEKDVDSGSTIPGGAIPGATIPAGTIPDGENSGGSTDTGPPVNPPDPVITEKPSFSEAYPMTGDIGEDSISILVKSGEPVTYYAVAFNHDKDRSVPSAAQVIGWVDAKGFFGWRGKWGPLNADIIETLSFKYMSSSTAYDIFIIAVDAAGNSSDVVNMTVTTKASLFIPPPTWVARDGGTDKGIMLQSTGLDSAKLAANQYIFELRYYYEQGTELDTNSQLPVSSVPYDICQAMAFMPEETAAVRAQICERGAINQFIPVSEFSQALKLTFTKPESHVSSFVYDGDLYTITFSELDSSRSHTLYVGYLTSGNPNYLKISGSIPENKLTLKIPSLDLKSSVTVCEITGASVSGSGEALLTIARQADISVT